MAISASVVLSNKLGFKVKITNTVAHFAIEADDPT
jgi:hypothetical protein